MPMLILETFVLMLLAAALGWALGGLLAEAYGAALAAQAGDGPAEPWLNELRPHGAAPTLPAAPQLLCDDERSRLAASLVETRTAPVTSAPDVTATLAAPGPTATPEVAAPPTPAPVVAPALVDTPIAESPTPVASPAPVRPEVVPETPAEAAAAEALGLDPTPALGVIDVERAAEADRHGARPLGLATARADAPDDLKRIKGIGKQNEARLNALGIWHFDQIAAWTPANVKWIGSYLAFPGRIDREGWIEQAVRLARGELTEFARRVEAGDVPTSSSGRERRDARLI